ncbi:lecithin retinol acyltransferase family protein [Thalassotalea sp. PS06]|uniref:lecithin retinol acyltransferase family protein n=1 Tax=Thalassotalea sp. PS06 TaxID=2594005 RepID=UPI001165B75B|nr:lecithin retinol acyltransferase family protein [Thalassotalea sp. PS06]QDP00910.1 hypothetical protein FNC98_05830 [Thalassotalea sp. PS06]
MVLPLVWVGAAIASAVAVGELSERNRQAELRRPTPQGHTRKGLGKYASGIGKYPKQKLAKEKGKETLAKIKPGALLCCGLGGVLEHTGILIDRFTIVELHGSGLVKAISPERFLAERSGSEIYVACDSKGEALASEETAERAAKLVYSYQQYDLIKNNCHRFAWTCINGEEMELTTFYLLNNFLSRKSNRIIYWDRWDGWK